MSRSLILGGPPRTLSLLHDPPPDLARAARRAAGRPDPDDVPRSISLGHVLLAVSVAMVVVLGMEWRGVAVGALFGVVMVTLPGIFVAHRVQAATQAERALITIVTSVVFWMAVAHLLLSIEVWYASVAVGGFTALFAFALSLTDRHVARGGLRAGATAWARSVGGVTDLTSQVILVLWALALPAIAFDDISSFGLVTELPITWFGALAVTMALAAHLTTRGTNDGRPTFVVATMTSLILFGSIAAVSTTIRYPWSYKHIGVIRLLSETGHFHPEVDIYNTFSGFFGLGALVRSATGVDPLSYAAWSQVVGGGLVALAVWVFVNNTTGRRRAADLAVIVYLITNWVGQDYFAPQTLASALAITTLALVSGWFADGRTRRWPVLSRVVVRVAPLPASIVDTRTLWVRRLVIGAAFLALLSTHPLTPAAVVLPLGAAVMLGWVRDRWLLFIIGVALMLWFARCLPYLVAQEFDFGFGGSVAANTAGNVDETMVPAIPATIGKITKAFSVAVWMLAGVGFVRSLMARRGVGLLAVVAFVPLVLPLLNSYGGEIIYRTYLYTLPGMAGLIAVGILGDGDPLRRWAFHPHRLATVVLLALAAGFVVVHYGRERMNHVDPSEVALAEYFGNLPEADYKQATMAGAFPTDLTARYPEIFVDDTYTPEIASMFDPSQPLAPQLDGIADDLAALSSGNIYVLVSQGTIDDITLTTSLPINTVQAALDLLLSSPRFELVVSFGDSHLLEVVSWRASPM